MHRCKYLPHTYCIQYYLTIVMVIVLVTFVTFDFYPYPDDFISNVIDINSAQLSPCSDYYVMLAEKQTSAFTHDLQFLSQNIWSAEHIVRIPG